MGLFVGTIVTFSLYMLSNSVLSVAAVPVMPQSFGNWQLTQNVSGSVRLKHSIFMMLGSAGILKFLTEQVKKVATHWQRRFDNMFPN